MDIEMVKVHSFGMTKENMKENGRRVNFMVKEHSPFLTVIKGWVNSEIINLGTSQHTKYT